MDHIIAVAHIGDTDTSSAPEDFFDGNQIGQRLGGVMHVAEAVDNGNTRCTGHFDQGTVIKHTRHDGIDVAFEHAGGVGVCLATSQLHVVGRQKHRMAAQLLHTYFERAACARRWFEEHHGEILAVQKLMGTPRRSRPLSVKPAVIKSATSA